MIALFKLITGEFVIGKKNDKDKVIEKPYLIMPLQQSKGFAIMDYYHNMVKNPPGIPYSIIAFDMEVRQQMVDKYTEMISPLSLPKKKLIDLSMHKNLN